MKTHPATDDEITLWFGEACGRSGAVIVEEHAGVYTVIWALEDAHREKSPNCPAGVRLLRVTRPNDLHKHAAELGGPLAPQQPLRCARCHGVGKMPPEYAEYCDCQMGSHLARAEADSRAGLARLRPETAERCAVEAIHQTWG